MVQHKRHNLACSKLLSKTKKRIKNPYSFSMGFMRA